MTAFSKLRGQKGPGPAGGPVKAQWPKRPKPTTSTTEANLKYYRDGESKLCGALEAAACDH